MHQVFHSCTAKDLAAFREAEAFRAPRLVFQPAEDVFYPGNFGESDGRWERQQAAETTASVFG